MKTKVQIRFAVDVSYSASKYPSKDSLIVELALANNGEEVGSGCGFGQRDITCEFKTATDAFMFIRDCKAEKLRCGDVMMWEDLGRVRSECYKIKPTA